MVWAKGKTELVITAFIRRDICSERFKIINLVLQYILLNSELTVSFLLLKKEKGKGKKLKTMQNKTKQSDNCQGSANWVGGFPLTKKLTCLHILYLQI